MADGDRENVVHDDNLATPQDRGLAAELWGFLKQSKKWWLLPMILAIVLMGLLIMVAGTGVAPFIYSLF